MHSTFLLLPLAILSVSAQSSTTSSSSPIDTASITSTSTGLSPTATCLAACSSADVNCSASCVGVPSPNTAQVNQTNSCAAACPQGDGSEAESNAYASCVSGCISSYYGPGATGGSVTVTTDSSGSTITETGSSTSKKSSGSSTTKTSSSSSTHSTPSSTKNAAAGPIVVSAGGLFGLFVAFLAL